MTTLARLPAAPLFRSTRLSLFFVPPPCPKLVRFGKSCRESLSPPTSMDPEPFVPSVFYSFVLPPPLFFSPFQFASVCLMHFSLSLFWVPITSEAVVNIIKANRGEPVASSRPTTPVRFVIARFFPSALHCLFSSRFSRPLGPFRVRSSRLPGFFTCSLAPRCFAPAHDSIVVHYFRLQIARLDYITKPQTHQRKDSHCLDMQSIPA